MTLVYDQSTCVTPYHVESLVVSDFDPIIEVVELQKVVINHLYREKELIEL